MKTLLIFALIASLAVSIDFEDLSTGFSNQLDLTQQQVAQGLDCFDTLQTLIDNFIARVRNSILAVPTCTILKFIQNVLRAIREDCPEYGGIVRNTFLRDTVAADYCSNLLTENPEIQQLVASFLNNIDNGDDDEAGDDLAHIAQLIYGVRPPNNAPSASFTVSLSGNSANFDASASTDPDGDALTYLWDFGEPSSGVGNTASGSSPTASHRYNAIGTYTVTLTVSDGTATSTTTRTVEVTIVLCDGPFQITATWDKPGDGDLVVTTPTGKTIIYYNRGPSAATDMGDLNWDDRTGQGPENICWHNGNIPPTGTYHVCFSTYLFTPQSYPITGTVTVYGIGTSPITYTGTYNQQNRPSSCAPGDYAYLGSFNYPA